MRALRPWTGTGLKYEMDRLLERFFESPWAEMPALGDWAPTLDVTEDQDAVIVKAELPGVDAKDVAVSLEGELLIIKGDKKQKKDQRDENGLMTVTLPKVPGARGTTIPIKAE